MPLTLTPIDHDDLCHGWRWEVKDEANLARKVGMVALGQYRHVAQILAGIDKKPLATRKEAAAAAIERLTVPDGGDSWHRDGWVFQTISWIAAHRTEKGIVARAHPMPSLHIRASMGCNSGSTRRVSWSRQS